MLCWRLSNRPQAVGRRPQILIKIVFVCFAIFFVVVSCFALDGSTTLTINPEQSRRVESRTFDGRIDFLHKDIFFSLDLRDSGKLEVSGNIEGERYNLKLKLRHLKFGRSDLSTDFYASGVIIKGADGRIKSIKGEAWTQASLLNFKPLKEFAADYGLKNGRLIIDALSWADFGLTGYIEKGPPAGRSVGTADKKGNSFLHLEADLFLTIKEMPLKDLAGLLGISPEDIELAGIISGVVRIKGPQDALKIEAKLTAQDGTVSQLKFKSAALDLEGIWPVLRFVHSRINDIEGVSYELKGKFNAMSLAELNSADHQVTVNSANEAMRFQDWVIKRKLGRGQEALEAAYPLKKNQALKMRIKNEEETLGWEKTVKF